MSLFKQLSTSYSCPLDPTWVVFPNNKLVNLFRVLVDLSNNIYAHMLVTCITFVNILVFSLNQPAFPYKAVSITFHVFTLCFAISNIYQYIWHKEAYNETLRRTVTIAQREPGSSYCDITALVASTFFLTVVCIVPLIALVHQQNWVIVCQVIWCIWFAYNISLIASFCVALSITRYCFQRMRYSLQDFADNTISHDLIIRFVRNYDELVDLCGDIDKHFGLRNTANIVFAFGTLVFQTFFIVERYLEWLETDKCAWISLLAYTILLGGIVGLLIFGCSSVESEAGKFNEVLSSLVIRETSGTPVSNPHVTAHFMIKRKLKFSGCGCFYIDYRLGYSMLTACITYLLVLIELDKGSPKTGTSTPAPTPSSIWNESFDSHLY